MVWGTHRILPNAYNDVHVLRTNYVTYLRIATRKHTYDWIYLNEMTNVK